MSADFLLVNNLKVLNKLHVYSYVILLVWTAFPQCLAIELCCLLTILSEVNNVKILKKTLSHCISGMDSHPSVSVASSSCNHSIPPTCNMSCEF